jgi:hypothetical protein
MSSHGGRLYPKPLLISLAGFVHLCYNEHTGQKALWVGMKDAQRCGLFLIAYVPWDTERDSCDPPAGVVIRFLMSGTEMFPRPG